MGNPQKRQALGWSCGFRRKTWALADPAHGAIDGQGRTRHGRAFRIRCRHDCGSPSGCCQASIADKREPFQARHSKCPLTGERFQVFVNFAIFARRSQVSSRPCSSSDWFVDVSLSGEKSALHFYRRLDASWARETKRAYRLGRSLPGTVCLC